MKSTYSELGKYIREVNVRNTNLKITNLLGVSMEKKFIPSVANLNGVDLSVYKVLKKDQLACKLMSVGRDEKLPVDLFKDENPAIVSSAYYVFEPKNKEELLPEYLMMWLCRPENDRYIGFISGGDVRGGISWDTFCSLPIKVPHPDKQREIVKEYNRIQNRITLNQQLIQKLEETAQTIYREWFVEGIDLENLPEGWRKGTLEDLYKFQYGIGNANPNNGGQYPIYGAGGVIGGFDKYNSEDAPVIGHMGEYCGKVVFAFGKHFVTYNGVKCIAKNESLKWFSYLTLLSKDLMSNTRGSSQPFVSYDMLYEIEALLPHDEIALNFDALAKKFFKQINFKQLENQKLTELKELLLSKLATVEN
jgi:type I restriction enzyme S subunit